MGRMKIALGIIQFWLIYFTACFFKALGKANVKFLKIPETHRGSHKSPCFKERFFSCGCHAVHYSPHNYWSKAEVASLLNPNVQTLCAK